MATIPVSGTDIRFLSGIPFSNDYKHTRYFNNVSDQTNYFIRKNVIHRMERANFQRTEGRTFVSVNRSIDSLHGTNYVMFRNAEYNNKWFYAFVTKLEYIQKNTTYIHFELDVYQTWRYNVSLKPSFVVREHCKLWNSDGTPVLNTVDENLDYGKEYSTVGYEHYKPMGDYRWVVVISKTRLHKGQNFKEIDPSRLGILQPLTYYLIPYNTVTGLPAKFKDLTGTIHSISTPANILKTLSESEETVNNIVSIFETENIGIETSISDNTVSVKNGNLVKAVIESKNENINNITCINISFISKYTDKSKRITDNKYKYFRSVKESKLLMYPYVNIVVDDFRGNRMELKPEYIRGKALELRMRGSLGTSNKTAYSISKYGLDSNISIEEDELLSYEDSIIDLNPNDIPVLTDHLASFLQGNRNSIQNQKNTITHNRNMALAQSGIDSVGSVASLATGNIVGGIKGLADSGLNAYKGQKDSVLKMQGIMAKQSDIGNRPPEISKMGSNVAFDYGNQFNGVRILWKQIKPEYIKKLEGFFNMYGYKVNEVKLPNIKTRRYWNYVQTENCVILGSINNEDLQIMKNIYDNGITLWHTDDIGNYSLNNYEI